MILMLRAWLTIAFVPLAFNAVVFGIGWLLQAAYQKWRKP